MLKVTDDGINVSLNPAPTANPLLTQVLLYAVFMAVIGGLKMLGVISAGIMALLVVVIVAGMGVWYFLQHKNTTKTLSGGELRLTTKGFTHYQLGKTTQYQLTPQNSVHIEGHTMAIRDAQGKALYHIHGFSDPKHLEIAHAVLQGKTIKTQGKSITMQSRD